ncbi:hypothetical protein F5Y03DRAFT_387245 [Xylaria venustula]|nr:hypothetical protein F5Y03DRAFT_387245 [Xylaria venustula]
MAGSIHLGLFPQCGACTDTIFRHERTIALYGDDASTSFRGITRPFLFPQLGYCMTEVDGFSLCRRPGCRRCAMSPEFVPLHWDCFEIFRNLSLPMSFPIDASGSPSLEASCGTCGFSQLYKLPLELRRIIQSYSKHALFWRTTLVFDLAARISHTTLHSLITMPLKDIVFWERGKRPQVRSSLPCLPLMRIIVDAVGISKVERISDQSYKGECHNSCVYIVEHEDAISEYKAQFKDGVLRLELAASSYFPAVWNTPNPPDLQLCRAYEKKRLSQFQRFFAVELDSIRGITFLFSSHQLYGIHIHRSTAPCASSSLQRFPSRRRRSTLWCYLPISNQDRVLVLGVRLSANLDFNILVRMQKAGDVIIGSNISGSAEDQCLGWHAPITLIYGESQEGQTVPYFGAYCRPTSGSQLPKRFQFHKAKLYPLGEDAYFSIASLEGIRSVEVFYDQDTRHCRGIVFYYQNGGCRAVGQCRVAMDSTRQFTHLSQICFRINLVRGNNGDILSAVQVDWKGDPHTHEEKGWKCEPLEGKLIYWYTHKSSFMAIEK